MKVRDIRWFRTKGERRRDNPHVLSFRMYEYGRWHPYSPVNLSLRIPTREGFVRYYLEWKAKNEG